MTDSTMLTAIAALRGGERAGLAAGARRNAETEADSRSVARFWLALAVLLENPGEDRVRALTAAADLDGQVRAILVAVLGKYRDLVADGDPGLAELWNECRDVLLDAGEEPRGRRGGSAGRPRTGRRARQRR